MPVNIDKMKKKKEELDKRATSGGNFWVPEEGRNIIRICPPVEGKDSFYHEFYTHWVPSAKRAFPCLNPPNGDGKGKCFLCQQAAKDSNLKARARYLMNIIDRHGEEKGVQLYNCGITILREVLGVITDPEWGDITDPDEGTDVIIDREGTGTSTTYTVRMRRKSSPLGDENLDNLHELDEVLSEGSYAEQKAAYLGDASAEEEYEEEEDGSPPDDQQPRCYGRFDPDSKRCDKCEFAFECELDSEPETGEDVEDESKESSKKPKRSVKKKNGTQPQKKSPGRKSTTKKSTGTQKRSTRKRRSK